MSKALQMSNTTRAKFTCVEVIKTTWNTKFKLQAVTGGSPENDKFFGTTPSGSLEIAVKNPDVEKMFEPGKNYYIDITEEKEA